MTAIIIMAVALALTASLVPASESDAAVGNCGDSITWSLDGTKLTISGTGDMYDYEDSPAPWGKSITSLVITGSPYNIGRCAFSGCSSLSSVDLGGVQQISAEAFSGCVSLTSVTIPDSVKSIMSGAFKGDSGLRSVTIGNKVTSIGEEAFSGCVSLKSVAIPDSVVYIEDDAFKGDSSLGSVSFGNKVKDINSGAFSGCIQLTSLSFPDSVRIIKSRAFSGDRNINSVTFGGGLQSLGVEAFPVEFEDLSGNKVTNPLDLAGHTYIYSTAGVLKEVSSEPQKCGDNLTWVLDGNKLTISGTGAMDDFDRDPPWGTSVTEVVFDGSPTSIGRNAFYGCPIKTVSLPDSVERIEEKAFEYCESLESVNLGSSLKRIGESAFHNCTSLTSVRIPDSVTGIYGYAFQGCSKLSTVDFGSSLNYLDAGAFYFCSALTSLTFPDTLTTISNIAFDGDKNIRHVSFGGSLISVGDKAFAVEFQDRNGNKVTKAADLCGHTYRSDDGTAVLREVAGEPVHPSSVALNKTSASLESGKTLKLTATVSPSNAADKSVSWSSSDSKVATVDQNGNVKAVSEGKATITASTNDGGKTATCAVTVTSASEPSSGSDDTLLYVGVAIAIVVLLALALLFMRSRGKI